MPRPALAFVALRSPRRGRVARRSPSIAIVGRRLLGRFLLGDSASERLELPPGFRRALSQKALVRTCRRAMPMLHPDAGRVLLLNSQVPTAPTGRSNARVGADHL
jgi:hypothetical protein